MSRSQTEILNHNRVFEVWGRFFVQALWTVGTWNEQSSGGWPWMQEKGEQL